MTRRNFSEKILLTLTGITLLDTLFQQQLFANPVKHPHLEKILLTLQKSFIKVLPRLRNLSFPYMQFLCFLILTRILIDSKR